jgi:hypothetical protein
MGHGLAHVFNPDIRDRKPRKIAFAQYGNRAFTDGLGDELMPISLRPGNSEKEVARFHPPGIPSEACYPDPGKLRSAEKLRKPGHGWVIPWPPQSTWDKRGFWEEGLT